MHITMIKSMHNALYFGIVQLGGGAVTLIHTVRSTVHYTVVILFFTRLVNNQALPINDNFLLLFTVLSTDVGYTSYAMRCLIVDKYSILYQKL